MQKRKKVILFFTLVLSLTALLMLYWEWDMPATAALHEGPFARVQIHGIFFKEYLNYTTDDNTPEQLYRAMEETKIDRGPKFQTLDGDAYLLWLYIEGVDGPMTVTVRQDGRMAVDEMGSNRRYFEGAADLYRQIQQITETLPAENLREE